MFVRTVLPNGLRVLTCPMPHVRSATICLYVGSGSRFEPEARAGLAHFVEHMVFKGTPSYPTARRLSEAIEGIGGILDASTSVEVTSYWTKVAAEHFHTALNMLAEMVLCPLLEPREVEKERRVIVEELHEVADSPADWVFELIGQALWNGHALGRDVAGTPEGVLSIGRDDLENHIREQYVPGRIVAVVAGALAPAEVEAALAGALGQLEAKPFRSYDRPAGLATGPRLFLENRDTEQANLCLAVPALAYNDPERDVLTLLDTILGGGASSRLFQEVREERALAYNVYSVARQHADTGALIVNAGVDPARAEECLAAIWAEMARLAEEGVGAEELRRAQEYNKGRLLLRMEDSYGVASWYGGQELLLEEVQEVDQAIGRLMAVQPEDIQRLAARLFRREQVRLAVVGPEAVEVRFS